MVNTTNESNLAKGVEIPHSEIRNPQSNTPQSNVPVSVLIVDDNPAKLIALEAALMGMDIGIVTATSGTEALHNLLEQEFAAVLLDVNMPVMDGFETAEMIRLRPKSEHLPILFITAERITDDARLQGYELGAVDYILSPILPQILRSKVAVFADLYRLREQIARQNLEMKKQLNELRRYNAILESREMRIIEVKHEVNELLVQAGQPVRYPSAEPGA